MKRRILAWTIAVLVVFGPIAYYLLAPIASESAQLVPGAVVAQVDFASAEDLEAALNAGENVVGKTATIVVTKDVVDGFFGYTLQLGEHLNLVSTDDPGVPVGGTLVVQVTKSHSFLRSWILGYIRLQ